MKKEFEGSGTYQLKPKCLIFYGHMAWPQYKLGDQGVWPMNRLLTIILSFNLTCTIAILRKVLRFPTFRPFSNFLIIWISVPPVACSDTHFPSKNIIIQYICYSILQHALHRMNKYFFKNCYVRKLLCIKIIHLVFYLI